MSVHLNLSVVELSVHVKLSVVELCQFMLS